MAVDRTTLAGFVVVAALAAAVSVSACAQDLTPRAPKTPRDTLVVGAEVHFVSAPPRVADVALKDGRIVAIGAVDGALSSDRVVVDGKGKRLYPGFVAPWTQLGLTEIGSVRATMDFDETGATTPEALAATAVNPDSWLFPVTRINGILTAATAPSGGAVPGRASVLRLEGWTSEDMTLKADAGVVVTWPYMKAPRGFGRGRGSRGEVGKDDVARAVALIDDLFAAADAYFDRRAADATHPIDVRLEGLRSALRPPSPAARTPVFVVADQIDQIQAAVAWGKKRGLKLVIVGGADADLCADLLKSADCAVIVNGVFRMPRRADAPYDDAFTLPKRLQAAGVRWCLASGEETPHERNLPYAAAYAAAYGLDRAAALRSITLSAAEILGVGDRLGSIDVGKAATIFLSDGDPLLHATKIERAWIDGREIALSDKQTALYERYRKKYADK
jgi:imidazolonepropionase-like amidohydrolase